MSVDSGWAAETFWVCSGLCGVRPLDRNRKLLTASWEVKQQQTSIQQINNEVSSCPMMISLPIRLLHVKYRI